MVADPIRLQTEFERMDAASPRLDAHAKAALRHRANLIAKWSHQQQVRTSVEAAQGLHVVPLKNIR